MTDPGPFRYLEVSIRDDVATLTIDRPETHNALNVAAMLDVDRALRELAFRPNLAGVVVAGAGDEAFSSGADLSEYDRSTVESERFHEARSRLSFEMARRARSLPVPTVARIDGYCIGAGLILAMYCDLRVADGSASFGLPTTEIGQVPGGGATYRLVELVGEAAAKELVLTGELVGAERAGEMGLVNRTVPEGELDAAVEDVLAGVRSGGIGATRAAKASINRQAAMTDREVAFEEELERWYDQFDTEERRRLMAEFLNRD